jgi:hypothetical protein
MLPDAGYRLKWTYGVEAFQQWCAQRNRPILTATSEGNFFLFSQIEKKKFFFFCLEAEIAKQYLVKSDLLSYINGDELQQIMDIFIREVRRPTGEEYLPESIYYLCLGKNKS